MILQTGAVWNFLSSNLFCFIVRDFPLDKFNGKYYSCHIFSSQCINSAIFPLKCYTSHLSYVRAHYSCSGSGYLVDGGVHLSPDVQGQVEQQEQEVSHRQRGQEQGGVVIGVTLPPKRKRLVCLVCKLILLGIHHPQHIFFFMKLPAHICQVDSNGYISSDSNLIKNVTYSLLSETAVSECDWVYSLCAYILLQNVIQFESSIHFIWNLP